MGGPGDEPSVPDDGLLEGMALIIILILSVAVLLGANGFYAEPPVTSDIERHSED